MQFDYKSIACPACSSPVALTRSVFRSDFRCPHCDAELVVSPLYTRLLVLLSVLFGYALAWEIGSLGPRSCFFNIPWWFFVLWIPIGFLVLTLLVRVAPFIVRPALVLRQSNHTTTLNLTSESK